MALHVSGKKSSRRGKVMAILAGGAIIGLGTTATLASWTDTEWVFGGTTNANGELVPGVGTSEFDVEQNVTSPYVADTTAGVNGATATTTSFVDRETNPGGGLSFTAAAIALSPGTSTYAPVALRTDSTSVAGALTLQPAVTAVGASANINDADGLLWNALTQRVWTSATMFTCDATAATNSSLTPVNSGSLAGPIASSTENLDAESGSTQFYCFEISLPAAADLTLPVGAVVKDLQGLTVVPAWEFAAVSR